MVYGQLGQWDLSEQAIADGSHLLPQVTDSQTKAQFYNNLGNIELIKGKGEYYLKYWQEAENLYRKAQDKQGILISQINQSKALKSLGKFRLSCRKLLQALEFTEEDCDNLTLQNLDQQLVGLKQKLSPNIPKACFVSGKDIPVVS